MNNGFWDQKSVIRPISSVIRQIFYKNVTKCVIILDVREKGKTL